MTSVYRWFSEVNVYVYDFMLLLPNSVSDRSYGSHFLDGWDERLSFLTSFLK